MKTFTVLALCCAFGVATTGGCSSSGGSSSGGQSVGSARVERTTVTRVSELQSNIGKQVTLVGTARFGNSADDSKIQLRGGAVELPAFRWPEGYVNHAVTVTGTIIDAQNVSGGTQANPGRAFRVGEVQDVHLWSK